MQNLENKKALLLLSILAFAVCIPYAIRLSISPSHDAMIFVIWMKEFSAEFFSGNLYPHWLGNLQERTGRPDFYFYPPLLFWIANIFYWPALMEHWPFFQMWATSTVVFAASGASCFFWLRSLDYSPKQSLVGAVLYLTAFNHYVHGLTVRSAIAEQLNYALLPLLMIYTDKVIAEGRKFMPQLAATMAAILLSNIPSALIILALPALRLAFTVRMKTSAKGVIKEFDFAYIIAASLSAFYWLPVLELKQFINQAYLSESIYNFSENFLSPYNTRDLAHLMFFWVIIVFTASCFSLFKSKDVARKNNKSLFWFTCCALSLFMMTVLSLPLWQNIPLMNLIQFPWRFGIILALFSIPFILDLKPAKYSNYIMVFLLGFSILFGTLNCLSGLKADGDEIAKLQHFQAFTKIMRETSFQNAPEYYTKWSDNEGAIDIEEFHKKFMKRLEVFGDNNFKLLSGDAKIKFEKTNSNLFNLNYTAGKESTVLLKLLYFPTWQAIQNRNSFELAPQEKTGFMKIAIPAGSGTILIEQQKTKLQTAGFIITIFTLLLIGSIFIFTNAPQKRN